VLAALQSGFLRKRDDPKQRQEVHRAPATGCIWPRPGLEEAATEGALAVLVLLEYSDGAPFALVAKSESKADRAGALPKKDPT
jgi:hypothetical protein